MPKPCLIQMEGTRRDPENCAKFSRCMNVGGEFLEITFDCPNSTIYSESKNICDYPDNVPERCETSSADAQSTTASTDLKASDQSATTSAETSPAASATTSATTSAETSATTSPAANAAASATTSVPLEATDKSKCVQRARRSERR